MAITFTTRDHLAHASARLSGAAVSLEHILTAASETSLQVRVEQQSPFIIEEIAAALDYMKRAVTAVEASRSIARADAAEQARAA